MTAAAILIPGVMGSVLKDGDEVIWPGSPAELLFPYRHMQQLIKPDLVAADVIRSVSVSRQYIDLIESLAICGFSETTNPPTLVVYPYDWRKDNGLAAQGLADCVDKVAASFGGGIHITFIAHSMGGLVARCYLESDLYDRRAGFAAVTSVIFMGTPHRGSPMALAAALGQEKRLFLNAEQVKTLANHPQFPAVYQLMPPIHEPYAWNRGEGARFSPVDIFDSGIAKQLGLNPESIDSAMRFQALLSLNRRPRTVRYFCFAGTRQTTTSSVQITLAGSRARIVKVDREYAGDGTVPIWSGSQSGLQSAPVGGEHGELYKNAGVKSILPVLLGKPTLLLAAGPLPDISVRHKVVTPGDNVEVVVDFPRGTTKVAGRIELRRIVDGNGTPATTPAVTQSQVTSYSGPQIDHLAMLLSAPQLTGVYEVGFVDTGTGTAAKTEMFVQDV